MHRRIVRPFGSSIPATRGFSLLLMLIVLGMLYNTIRQPAMWRFLADRDDEAVRLQVAPAALPAEPPVEEVIVPGPNDLDPDTMTEFKRYAELITDRTE